jgi:hypothetical protein
MSQFVRMAQPVPTRGWEGGLTPLERQRREWLLQPLSDRPTAQAKQRLSLGDAR